MRLFCKVVNGAAVTENGLWTFDYMTILGAHPNIGLPTSSAFWEAGSVPELGYVDAVTNLRPSFDPLTHNVVQVAPVLYGGVWGQQWQVVAIDAGGQFAALGGILAGFSADVQAWLEGVTQSWGYDKVDRMPVYINSANQRWAAEAAAILSGVTSTWEFCASLEAQVLAGTAAMPADGAALVAMLPPIVRPT